MQNYLIPLDIMELPTTTKNVILIFTHQNSKNEKNQMKATLGKNMEKQTPLHFYG